MRSRLSRFDLHRARSLDEASGLLAAAPGRRPFAGGTDLMVLLAAGALPPGQYVSIRDVTELRTVTVVPDAVGIGALATFTDVRRSALLRTEFPLLGAAAAEIGGLANQNRGTIGGNIANASPAADSPPALLVYDAELELVSLRGLRRVPYRTFHTGYKQMDLAPDEIVTRVWLPRGRGDWVQSYRKVGARRAQAISKVCFAGAARVHDGRITDIRLAFASVAPTVLRAAATEAILRGTELDDRAVHLAVASLGSELAPIDDIRSTARYRARVAQNLLREFLHGLRPPP